MLRGRIAGFVLVLLSLPFLTVHEDPDYVQAAINIGALGYVVKARMVSDLQAAIRGAMAERLFISPSCTFGSQYEHGDQRES